MILAQLDIQKAFLPAKNFGTVASILNLIIPLLMIGGGILFAIMFLTAAFKIITAGGETERVKKAQDTMKFAVVGFVIVIVAYLGIRLIQVVFNLPQLFQ